MNAAVRLAFPLFVFFAVARAASAAPDWEGAWLGKDGERERALLVVDGYLAHAEYGRGEPAFYRTFGGPLEIDGERAAVAIQFDSEQPERVGGTLAFRIELDGDALALRYEDGSTEAWERAPGAASPLDGVWRISQREVGGAMAEMPLRARRTLKILAGARFQWIAMNVETGEFSGTGGGRFEFANGAYVETIEFFSRDSARVGARLEFQGEVEGGAWRHRGLSSRGEPIHEVWTRFREAK